MNATDRKPSTTARRGAGRIAAFCVVTMLGLALSPLLSTSFAETSRGPCTTRDPSCNEREARRLLAQGDAEIAAGEDDPHRIESAIYYWEQAVDVGLGSGAQASLTAQKRIQMYTLTCIISEMIGNVTADILTDIHVQREALTALGYYQKPRPKEDLVSVKTRSAIRKFQSAMAWNETGHLKARQIVYLICNAAETARSAPSRYKLAQMYVAGVGVTRNDRYARTFFSLSSPRYEQAKGTLFLALLYGTGRCEFPSDLDRATPLLKEAIEHRNHWALVLWRRYGHLEPLPIEMWQRIAADDITKNLLAELGKPCPRHKSETTQTPQAPQR
jgi:hypothetical protein